MIVDLTNDDVDNDSDIVYIGDSGVSEVTVVVAGEKRKREEQSSSSSSSDNMNVLLKNAFHDRQQRLGKPLSSSPPSNLPPPLLPSSSSSSSKLPSSSSSLSSSSSSPIWQPFYIQSVSTAPEFANRNSLSLSDIIDPNGISNGLCSVIVMNYIVDIDILLNECPVLLDPRIDVVILHGTTTTITTTITTTTTTITTTSTTTIT